ncbi:hypothetical protein EHF33_17455 (plasmid) [Deinococcus psychrotolerans]|uniref:Uncharacterized protein n=1 Tax=Deinococcus psychrotolerans TaxID=2489213 RepID=A0A3G8YHB7_9DEIO|nr:hypothetical protein [Deinococcus psychrotolerans]AZI44682.1 hypothetical protein EHF33_17455 [Deinococcus psychrotolerans]
MSLQRVGELAFWGAVRRLNIRHDLDKLQPPFPPLRWRPAYVLWVSDDLSQISEQMLHPDGGEVVNG